MDFGLKVRNSDTGILITARNKPSLLKPCFSKDFSSMYRQAYILTKDKDIEKIMKYEIISFIRQNISQKLMRKLVEDTLLRLLGMA